MSIIKTFQPLYGVATNGKIKTISISVEQIENGSCDIVTSHGYIDGQKQKDRRNVAEGKNIGKTNETTVQEQACLEAEARWKKKLDANYTTNETGIPDASELSLLPMLAHKFDDRSHKIEYPCIVQPKLDGMRCLTTLMPDGTLRYTSRKFKEWTTLSHLESEILHAYDCGELAVPLDGEIYVHGMHFQEIARRLKKYREGLTEELEYWVYDLMSTKKTNEERDQIRKKMLKNGIKLVYVESHIANSEEEVYKLHDQFVQDGYEGAIIRNMDGKYAFDKRSTDLQKYKKFQDEEFEIVGVTSGEGRETGAIIYICKVKNPTSPDRTTFEVRPRGSIEMRREAMKDTESVIGRELTVRYQNFSEDNVPIFPVGIIVRED